MSSQRPSVFVADDVLSEDAVRRVRGEIEALAESFVYDDANPDYTKYRIHLDGVFQDRREQSVILGTVQQMLFQKSLVERAQGEVLDFCIRSLPYTNFHVTYVTAHVPGRTCGWHANDITHHAHLRIIFTLSFIYYVDCGGSFEGGRLLVSHDLIPATETEGWEPARPPTAHEAIEPRPNRLVLLPSTYWHMVEPITAPGWQRPLDGRVSVNGHIGFALR